MKVAIIFFAMVFLHIIDDYVLQSFSLCNLKQKDYWREQKGYNKKYKNDYITALFCHAFSWSFMIHIPIMIINWIYFSNSMPHLRMLMFTLIGNFIIHAIIDEIKANLKMINLYEDQAFHLIQITFTWVMYCFVPGTIEALSGNIEVLC